MARYFASTWFAGRAGATFPWGTLAVNLAGSFLIGILVTMADEKGTIGPGARLFLVVGFLGGFTTFSSFSIETWRLAEGGDLIPALLNVLGSVTLGLTAAVLGVALGRALEG
jgi:fluoride exporter